MGNRRGFALAAAMMVLALLSVLGVAAMQSTTLEVQISARDRDSRLALYLAQSALEEARYYVARDWGKVSPYGTGVVEITTPNPPGLSWDGNRYAGFTLLDSQGERFTVQSHTATAPLRIAVASGTPAAGRFLLAREGFAGTWDGTRLVVADPAWAQLSGTDTWQGWLLWDAAGRPYPVAGSDTAPTVNPQQVFLQVTPPGAGPYSLSRNPWLSALASGASPAGDADTSTPARWDRIFYSAPGEELGRGSVTARAIPWTTADPYRGAFQLDAAGVAGESRREATVHVYYAGLPSQRIRDWKVR